MYDPDYVYDRINNPAPPFQCIKLTSINVPRMIKGTAGGVARYSMQLKGAKFGRVLAGLTSTAEFMLTLPTGVGFGGLKVRKGTWITMGLPRCTSSLTSGPHLPSTSDFAQSTGVPGGRHGRAGAG